MKPLQATARRRRVWRVVGVRVGLPRHDMEVEGVLVKDDAVLELRVRICWTCRRSSLTIWIRCTSQIAHGDVVRRLLDETGNNTIFTPIVMAACGAMGPLMVTFFKEVNGRAKGAHKFLMSQQPALKYSWNTMVVSSFFGLVEAGN